MIGKKKGKSQAKIKKITKRFNQLNGKKVVTVKTIIDILMGKKSLIIMFCKLISFYLKKEK